jgi:VanZ family protein
MKPLLFQANRILAWFLTAAVAVLSLVPPGFRPVTGAPRAIEHFVIFAATGMAFGLCYGARYLVPIALVIFAGAIELAQLMVPGRHARIGDFVVDAFAACSGFVASYILMRTLEVTLDRNFPRHQ